MFLLDIILPAKPPAVESETPSPEAQETIFSLLSQPEVITAFAVVAIAIIAIVAIIMINKKR